ncbi:MAG: DivIVA domain-containing protein [Acidimicrobiia bacterium]|nr:DivIVA domain-containing protein [Acidimicrobiia bacterium]
MHHRLGMVPARQLSLAWSAMATMDITPQELRDIEIREAWRGYHRDDVDELLERAAATIEHLEMEIAQSRGRSDAAPLAPPPPVPVMTQPAPAPAPIPAVPMRGPETDMIQRTLLLAQKAADEAVAEAKLRASQIVTESEERAQELVAEAEANARRIADVEKTRLEEDIARLTEARDTLTADVDALERFEQEYRDRLRHAIQAEMDLLEATAGEVVRPELSEIDLPDSGPSWSASQEGVAPAPVAVIPVAPVAPMSTPTVHIEAVPAYTAPEVESDWDPAPAGGWTDDATVVSDRGEFDLPTGDDYVADGDSLDDDAFFASLREAVRDDAPLGPARDDDSQYFDEDDTKETKRLFKRRR